MIKKKLIISIIMGAMLFLAGCSGDKAQRLQQLEQLEQQNRSGQPMLNDSLAEDLVKYFDRHGDANERMRSRYILGRTYYCLDELPRALETYSEAIDCADTTSSDCDFAKLSRVYAQKAAIYYDQVQARTQLENLRLAEYYAWKGMDTLMAVECFSQQSNVYELLGNQDSIVIIKEAAAQLFKSIERVDRAAQTLGSAILALVKKRNLLKASIYIKEYESNSNFFSSNGEIEAGREIYYYIKGEYYLALGNTDSAEYLFRKEIKESSDLNNRIAAYKGLQKLYVQKKNIDSVAKYSTLAYMYNDSAYSLSEMQNIQKFQASYNYHHQKELAEQSKRDAERSRIVFVCFIVVLMAIGGIAFASYRSKKQKELADYRRNLDALGKVQSELQALCGEEADVPTLIARKNEEIRQLQLRISEFKKHIADKDKADLEDRLSHACIVLHLNDLLTKNPVPQATRDDIHQLSSLLNEQIPTFYNTLNASVVLRPLEYEVCMLTRCHFKPSAIARLLDLDESYVSNIRRRILHKVYGIEGNPRDLDERLMAIA
jgi:tetratricopeptide (TPR) repeat protein/DNA-binding CsgD family transcriptional regulator